jgi:hypothetical protein
MSDRTPEQLDQTLDRLLEVAAANTSNITANSEAIAANSRNIAELQLYVAQVAGTVERIALATDQRLNRQDQIISMLSSYITGIAPATDEPS